MTLRRDDILSHRQLCEIAHGAHVTKGMNYRIKGQLSVLLMSVRENAPYADQIGDSGMTLVYEGHDVPRSAAVPYPKLVDQELFLPSGKLTENGKFYRAVQEFQAGSREAESVVVFEKIKKGLWSYTGTFRMTDARPVEVDGRRVFKYSLELDESAAAPLHSQPERAEHNRLIPTEVKIAVWNRDRGKCTKCGTVDMLHFDHVIPFSKGGSSVAVDNIQLLCARHNLEKRADLAWE